MTAIQKVFWAMTTMEVPENMRISVRRSGGIVIIALGIEVADGAWTRTVCIGDRECTLMQNAALEEHIRSNIRRLQREAAGAPAGALS